MLSGPYVSFTCNAEFYHCENVKPREQYKHLHKSRFIFQLKYEPLLVKMQYKLTSCDDGYDQKFHWMVLSNEIAFLCQVNTLAK